MRIPHAERFLLLLCLTLFSPAFATDAAAMGSSGVKECGVDIPDGPYKDSCKYIEWDMTGVFTAQCASYIGDDYSVWDLNQLHCSEVQRCGWSLRNAHGTLVCE